MKKRRVYLSVFAPLLGLIVSYLVYYFINVDSEDRYDLGENIKESDDIDWINFKPFDFQGKCFISYLY